MPLKPVTAMRKDKSTGKSGVQLQHRHIAFIANVLATSGESNDVKRRLANYFAQDLEKTNPNFDRARFFTAVGVDDPYMTQAAYPRPLSEVKKSYAEFREETGLKNRLKYLTED